MAHHETSYTKIKVEAHGPVTVVTMADPATMNACGVDMAGELLDAFRHAAHGPSPARACLLTGEGRGFCSGANLQSGPASRQLDADGKPDAGAALETVPLIRSSPSSAKCPCPWSPR